MDTAPRISVTYLVSTAGGGSEQVKHCKLSSYTKLQLSNIHTKKFLIRKRCEIKIFTSWLREPSVGYAGGGGGEYKIVVVVPRGVYVVV